MVTVGLTEWKRMSWWQRNRAGVGVTEAEYRESLRRLEVERFTPPAKGGRYPQELSAQEWLDRLGPDPDAEKHAQELDQVASPRRRRAS